ncbi:hypothetical protein BH11VER1_BH11VER1_40650 [soil metagenome]
MAEGESQGKKEDLQKNDILLFTSIHLGSVMSSSSDPIRELAKLESWQGLRPGMTHQEVMVILKEAGVEVSAQDKYETWLMVDDWEMEFEFETDGQQRLRQISCDHEALTWRGKTIIGVPLHLALRAMEDISSKAAWSARNALNELQSESEQPGEETVTDDMLLSEGSLWFPDRCLALVMCGGLVNEIAWRRAEDMPKSFAGSVTAEQLTLSARVDLSTYLRETHRARMSKLHRQNSGWSPLQWMIAAFTVCVMGLIGRQAWQETQRWQQPLEVSGRLLGIETDPGPQQTKTYLIEFQDTQGGRQIGSLKANDFYVAPREVGEEVPLFYVADNPREVRGAAHARDAAFLRYMPWVIGALFFHAFAMLTAGFLSKRKVKKVQSPSIKESRSVLPEIKVIK